MAEKKSSNVEREYVIPLRPQVQHAVRYKRTPKAVKTVKEFLAKHMKVYDRDLNKIKIDKHLNEYLWFRGIKNPPHKVKVKAVKEGDIVRVELAELTKNLKFKKARLEKRETAAKAAVEASKSVMQKAKESMSTKKDSDKDGVDDKKDVKEKKEAVKEEGQKIEKEMAKVEKKTTKVKTPQKEAEEATSNKQSK